MASLDEIKRWARGRNVEGLPRRNARKAAKPKMGDGDARLQSFGKYKINTEGDDALLRFGQFTGSTISQLASGGARKRRYLQWILRSDFPDDLKSVVRFQQAAAVSAVLAAKKK